MKNKKRNRRNFFRRVRRFRSKILSLFELVVKQFVELPRQIPVLRPVAVVRHAVGPHQANVGGDLARVRVMALFEVLLDRGQVHRPLDHLRIVPEVVRLPIHGQPERFCRRRAKATGKEESAALGTVRENAL